MSFLVVVVVVVVVVVLVVLVVVVVVVVLVVFFCVLLVKTCFDPVKIVVEPKLDFIHIFVNFPVLMCIYHRFL